MIAGSSSGKNPIVGSVKKGLDTYQDIDPSRIKESLINEPLVNWHSIDGELAFQAISDSGGLACNVSDKTMSALSAFIKTHEGLSVLPASTAGLSALLDIHKKSPLPGDRYVAVLTGRK